MGGLKAVARFDIGEAVSLSSGLAEEFHQALVGCHLSGFKITFVKLHHDYLTVVGQTHA